MRIVVAKPMLIAASLLCSILRPIQATACGAECSIAGPAGPLVDGDLDADPLVNADLGAEPSPVDQTKHDTVGSAATSDAARIAPGPSERAAPGAPSVRQSPPGGQNKAALSSSTRTPCTASGGKCDD